jgi:hypothetical protein
VARKALDVVGWATSTTNDRTLALAALERTLRDRRPAEGLLHHNDRGELWGAIATSASVVGRNNHVRVDGEAIWRTWHDLR